VRGGLVVFGLLGKKFSGAYGAKKDKFSGGTSHSPHEDIKEKPNSRV
jgi:hypothetical protein